MMQAPSVHYWLYMVGCLAISHYILGRLKRWQTRVEVPVVGKSGLLGLWKAAFRLTPDEILQEGYDKHRDFAFQFATLAGWEICICNEAMVKQLANLPESEMSLYAFNDRLFQSPYTSPGFADCPENLPIQILAKALAWARARGTAGAGPYFSGLVEEIECGLALEVNPTAKCQQRLNCFSTGLHLMLRVITSVLFGRPLCRDAEMIDLFARYGASVPRSGQLISSLPPFLRPMIAPRCEAPRLARQLDNILLKLVDERRKLALKEPETIVDWLCAWTEQTSPRQYQDLQVVQALVSVVFGSVHSAGTVLATCLYELSNRPQYIAPLRDEVQRVLQNQAGLGKEAIESMVKLDSFIKECHRHNPISPVTLTRVAKQEYTFANGLHIPEGTLLHTPNTPQLLDERHYEDCRAFDGFRFYRLGQQTGRVDDYKLAGNSPKNRQFGTGRHTCPGKQLAADSLRLIMAYILANFVIASDCNRPSHFSRESTFLLERC